MANGSSINSLVQLLRNLKKINNDLIKLQA